MFGHIEKSLKLSQIEKEINLECYSINVNLSKCLNNPPTDISRGAMRIRRSNGKVSIQFSGCALAVVGCVVSGHCFCRRSEDYRM